MTCKLRTQAAEKLGEQVCKDLEKGEVHLSNFVACGRRVTSSSLGRRGMKNMGGPIKESNLYLKCQDKSLKDFKHEGQNPSSIFERSLGILYKEILWIKQTEIFADEIREFFPK